VLLLLATLATIVHAEPKRSLVVAGVDAVDSESVPLAEKLLAALRGVKSPRYAIKATPKQVAAALVKAECRVTQTPCAAAVGAALAAEYVLAGEATRKGAHQVLVLALVNVRTKQRVRSLREIVATSVDSRKWAHAMFQRLVDSGAGELHLAANVKRGEVWIDGELVGALFDGRFTLGNLALGTHRLVVRADGYRPLETEVTIDGITKEMVLLEPIAK
jgi:hypothetical protein